MKYIFMRYPRGLSKAVTLSYDDGTPSDMRLCDTITRHGMKGTFNLVGSEVETRRCLPLEYVKEGMIARGHEITNHGYLHRAMDCIRTADAVAEVLDGRRALERELGIIIRAYTYADRCLRADEHPEIYGRVRPILEDLDVTYARTAGADNDSFDLPTDFYQWMPTAHHNNPRLFDWIDRFTALDVDALYVAERRPRLFYIWGHSREFDTNNNWERLDEICRRLGGRDDTWYATNGEIYDYVQAFRSLVFSADRLTVYNPTLIDVYLDCDGTPVTVPSGATVTLS